MDAIPPPLERAKECANVRLVKGDVRSSDLLSYVLQSERIDTVMHFLAQSHVDNSFGNSYDFTKNISDCLIQARYIFWVRRAGACSAGRASAETNERTSPIAECARTARKASRRRDARALKIPKSLALRV